VDPLLHFQVVGKHGVIVALQVVVPQVLLDLNLDFSLFLHQEFEIRVLWSKRHVDALSSDVLSRLKNCKVVISLMANEFQGSLLEVREVFLHLLKFSSQKIVNNNLLLEVFKKPISNSVCFINVSTDGVVPNFELFNVSKHPSQVGIGQQVLSIDWVVVLALDLGGQLSHLLLKSVYSEGFFEHFHFFQKVGVLVGL